MRILLIILTFVFSLPAIAHAETVTKDIKSKQSPREIIDRGFRGLIREKWSNAKPYGAQIVTDPPGGLPSKALRMELRYGDCGKERKWDDCKHRNERVELSKYNAFKVGQRKQYEWKVYFAPGFSERGSQRVIVTQFSMMGVNSHPFQFLVRNGRLEARKKVESTEWGYESLVRTLIPRSSLTGRWHHVKVDAKWTLDDTGHFFVWVNDKPVYQWKGRTLGEGTKGKVKLGIYRHKTSPSAPPIVMYLANLNER